MDTSPPVREPQDVRQPRPAMDIMPSRPAEAPKMPPPDTAVPAPVATAEPAAHHAHHRNHRTQAPVSKPPKAPGGAGLAVSATVVIVLGLGALLVYAYLRSNGISVF